MQQRGVLLVNLGSPASPSEQDVRAYLNQFLMDEYVIDLPWLIRRLLLSLFILPTRPARSAEAYQSVWTEVGAPLLVNSQHCFEQLQTLTEATPLGLAMRYGEPSIESELLRLTQQHELDEILLIPLYPHYAMSSVKTVIEHTKAMIVKHHIGLPLTIQPLFYDDPDYIEALVSSAEPWLTQPYDHLVFSYHGVPERHIRKDDTTRQHCLRSPNCCQILSVAHQTCYRHQVGVTTQRFVERANIPIDKYSIGFQSRLGRAKWLEPNTLDVLKRLAEQGAKNVLVICPSFVSDCLETLEEIQIGAKEAFIEWGGESLTLIPCLNDHPKWVNLLAKWVSDNRAC